MTIFCPASFAELRAQLEQALFEISGPVAIRYPRGGEGEYREASTEPEQILREGRDVTLLCCGVMVNEVLKAARLLEERGIRAEIVKINRVSDQPWEQALASLKKTGRLVAAEEVCAEGCLGEKLISQAAEREIPLRGARLLNLGKGIVAHGDRALLMRDAGIDAASIAAAAEALCKEGKERT